MFLSSQQQGFFLLGLLLLITGTLLYSLPHFKSSPQNQTITNIDILNTAKAALIGRALRDNNRIGSLPCPDNNNDGIADLFAGQQCSQYLGYLPWSTLGIGQVMDNSATKLWYSLSPNFRDHSSIQPLNSDSFSDLMLDDKTMVAVIIAPHAPLNTQSRPSLQASDYLEAKNSLDDSIFQHHKDSNDQLLGLSITELIDVMEEQILSTVTNALRDYRQTFGQLWLTPLNFDKSRPNFIASVGTRFGYLPYYVVDKPFATDLSLDWQINDIDYTLTGEMTLAELQQGTQDFNSTQVLCIWNSIEYVDCEAISNREADSLPTNERKEISIKINYWGHVNKRLANASQLAHRQVIFDPEDTRNNNLIPIILTILYYRDEILIGRGTINSLINDNLQLSVDKIHLNVGLPAGLIDNQWHHQLMAVIAPDEVPAGTGCIIGINCLQLSPSVVSNNKTSLLLLAGKRLAGQTRPSQQPQDYFEGKNQQLDGFLFQRNVSGIDFNDKIAPFCHTGVTCE